MYITLEEAKAHLYVEHNEDDEYIRSLIEVAEENLVHLINRPISEVLKEGQLPAPLKHVLKLLIGKLYAYREGDRPNRIEEAAFTLPSLFMPYRKEV